MNRLLLLFSSLLLLFTSRAAYASHAQGGQLTYESLGNNRYRVTCRYFRDCSGIAAETTLTLNCRVGTPTTSCSSNDSRNFTATLVRGTLISGTPYCSSLSTANQCSPNSTYANYETTKYTADITLPPAPEWTLSVEISARPAIKNIGGNTTLRFEATLNNQLVLANGTQQTLQNTSPQYQDQDVPVPFVHWNQRNNLTFFTQEPDGDSIVYSLDRPLEGCNVYSTYSAISNTPNVILDPSNTPTNPCVIQIGALPATYTPNFPILSYNVTGNCPVRSATPYFQFNRRFSSITFTPALFTNSASTLGDNKYAIVNKVTEYRKIGSAYYKIGSVRQDMLVVVVDGGTNQTPRQPTLTNGSTTTSLDTLEVMAQAGVYRELDYNFSDPNPGDQLSVSIVEPSDAVYLDLHVNPSAPARPVTVLNNGTATPSLKIRLRPDPYLLGRTFRIPVKVQDNACPVKATQYYVLTVRVVSRVTAARTAARREQLTAYPTPFTDEAHFTLPRPAGPAAPVLIIDQLGRVVDHLSAPTTTGVAESKFTWRPAATVPAGIYSARFADGQYTVRLVRVAP